MDFMDKTNKYYSLWLGEADILCRPFSGVRWVYSPERNQIQTGYSQQFDIYILFQPERTVISYGENIISEADEIRKQIQTARTFYEVEKSLVSVFGSRCQHFIKYVFDKPEKVLQAASYAGLLSPEEYLQFKEFFTANNPGCTDTGWLEPYFMDLQFHGVYVQNKCTLSSFYQDFIQGEGQGLSCKNCENIYFTAIYQKKHSIVWFNSHVVLFILKNKP